MRLARSPTKPAQCRGCPLFDAHGPVFGVGPKDADIMLVGEAPGPDECNKKEPFIGRAGWTLDVAMKGAGVERSKVYITNVCKCMPYVGKDKNKFRRPTREEMQFCGSRWLDVELRDIDPNVTVALGAVAAEYLTKGTLRGDITGWRGKVVDVDADEHTYDDEDIPF